MPDIPTAAVPPLGGDRSVPRSRVKAGDASIDRRGRVRQAPPFLSYGFRPFFLLGAGYASLTVPLWLWEYFGGRGPAGALSGLAWHAHEMIFGYLAAVMAGFVLTAVPNWTGRLPLSGTRLAGLVTLWLLGRIALLADPEPWSAAAVDLLFPLALAGAVWREIVAGRNFGNAPIAVLLSFFTLANLLDHLGVVFPMVEGYGVRSALSVAALLIALVGGRVTPSFTRNWMSRAGLLPLPAPMDAIDRLAVGATALALLGWTVAPDAPTVGAGLLVAALLLFARLLRWRGHRTVREPIVLILHLGYLWLVVALLLLGLAALVPWLVPASAAIHALTAGAIGTMTLAVMTRASRGHTGRPIVTDGVTIAIYALVSLAAILRVLAPWSASRYPAMLVSGGFAWSAAFALFVIAYGPMLVTKRASG